MTSKKQPIEYDFDKFMNSHVADIFSYLEKPEESERAAEEIKKSLRDCVELSNYLSVPEAEREKAMTQAFIREAKNFDLKILDVFSVSVEEFIKFVRNKRKLKEGGKTLHPETPKQKVIAAYAFHFAHNKQKTRAEALGLAARWIDEYGFDKPVSKITIGHWLDELTNFFSAVLPKSNRGRKRNIK